MSDLFIAAGIAADATDIAGRLSWTAQTKAWSGRIGVLTWVVTRVDDPTLWAPAFDAQSGIRALLGGRIAPEEAEWKCAEALPYEGGLACRLIIERWIKGGAGAVEDLNGGAEIFVIDERNRTLHVWTDRMGFYPAFGWFDDGFVLCSHPDVLARTLEAAGRPLGFDPVTMAEFLRTGTATHPHAYWHGVRQLDAGTHFRFDVGADPRLRDAGVYWRPPHMEGKPYLTDRGEIVERLAHALQSAVRRRTLPRLGKVAVLLSSGADSRTALFGACEPSKVTCYTVYDEPNAEVDGARKLVSAASAIHVTFQRPKQYYFEQAWEAVRLSAGMWSIESAHFGGLTERFREQSYGVVLTGCYADYLLKGLSFNRRHQKLLGRYLPLYEFSDYSHEWYQPFSSLNDEWSRQVQARLDLRFGGIGAGDRDQSRAEYLRLAPMMREADVSGRLILRRTCAHDFFICDNDVLNLIGQIVPHEKINGIAFGMAVEKITGRRAQHVPNSNYNAPVGAMELQRVAAFVLASLGRKMAGRQGRQPFERDPRSVATVGSWPYYPRVIKLSARARSWRSDLPREQEELLFDIVGKERRSWTIDDWADRNASLFLRLYTASLWLSQNPTALGRVLHNTG